MTEPQMHSDKRVVRPGDLETMGPPPDRPRLAVRSFGMTDVGRVRTSNEDQFLVATLVKSLQIQHTSLPQPATRRSTDRSYLFIVADGVGGSAAGEKASALAVTSVEDYVLHALKWFAQCPGRDDDKVLSDFRTALGVAHDQMRSEAAEHPELHGMGTTLTLAYSLNDELFVAHVGDSRCYLFREGVLYRLTQDHTLVEEMIQRGVIKAEEAAEHRWRHVVTSTIGGTTPELRIDVHRLHLAAEDVVLLCSDGLTEMVSVDAMAALLAGRPEPEDACRELVRVANDAGGKDNVTVVMARFEVAR